MKALTVRTVRIIADVVVKIVQWTVLLLLRRNP